MSDTDMSLLGTMRFLESKQAISLDLVRLVCLINKVTIPLYFVCTTAKSAIAIPIVNHKCQYYLLCLEG
jgi:hypothetical protein